MLHRWEGKELQSGTSTSLRGPAPGQDMTRRLWKAKERRVLALYLLKHKLREGTELLFFPKLMYPQCLELCLAHSRFSAILSEWVSDMYEAGGVHWGYEE